MILLTILYIMSKLILKVISLEVVFMRKKNANKELFADLTVALGICLLEQLCFTVFTVLSFGILGDFRSFHLLGFRRIFRHSIF